MEMQCRCEVFMRCSEMKVHRTYLLVMQAWTPRHCNERQMQTAILYSDQHPWNEGEGAVCAAVYLLPTTLLLRLCTRDPNNIQILQTLPLRERFLSCHRIWKEMEFYLEHEIYSPTVRVDCVAFPLTLVRK